MSEQISQFRPLDPGRINLMDPAEVQYWCQELGCTASALEDAVDEVGEHIAAVRAQLEAGQPGAH
ncbi:MULTISPECIES: DUF3606 domain-containing protein [Cupriavidus]|uniref:DUF3606 domain-containing protein n=1 Tax=Cupriavidus pinatubonensis TaxID=248026 RepID=A0ABM8WJ52_9BURK|nr:MULTISPECIES: DUF3606 domain-containing protein [Cupriavidus]QYY30345.1 DUF3606 domain-containing protein [Cupriavidus pinatubonensis]TPQ34928.1 DUF3606 domain-containing protein [Cupriavidus pinatubonensis]CAG9167315.1 hypothetical protein LMG23994_01169 [Cupriavidus pinatubonensis]